MCGRATLTMEELEIVAKTVESAFSPADAALYRPRYNLAPTDRHWIVRTQDGQRVLVPGTWGFTGKVSPLLINVRAETAPTKFKSAFANRRCAIPVDGFYEWIGSKKTKHPIWFHTPEKKVFLLAGLFEEREGGELAFAILTTQANALVAAAHDRMPEILPFDKLAEWLSVPVPYVLEPAPEKTLIGTEVSSRANSVTQDDPSFLVGWNPAEAKGEQLRLL